MSFTAADPVDQTFLAYLLSWLVLLAISIGLLWIHRLRKSLQVALDTAEQAATVDGSHQPASQHRLLWLEVALVLIGVSLYCANFLTFDAGRRLPGNEAEVFQVLDWVLLHAIRPQGGLFLQPAFPLWNPFLHSGLPYIADPMSHVYNPVVTLPVILLGVHNGFTLAVFLSFLIGALGMWRFGVALGLSRPIRIWLALMFALAGQPTARFFQGQYLFVFGFAWIPWVVLGFLLIAEQPRRTRMIGTAAALALLFFSGNAYYAFYMVFIVALLGLVTLVSWRPNRPGPQPVESTSGTSHLPRRPWLVLDKEKAQAFLLTALLALGMVAVQLLPTAQFWPYISKSLDLEGSHTPVQVFLDFTSRNPERPDAYAVLPAREEFYAYIGIWPFLALPFLLLFLQLDLKTSTPQAVRRRKTLPFLILLLIFVLVWIDLKSMPWYQLFLNTRWLLQFRHLLRILIFGSFALLGLAALGLDSLWRYLQALQAAAQAESSAARLLTLGQRIGLTAVRLGNWGVLLFLLISVGDLFQTNSSILRPLDTVPEMYQVANWLRQNRGGFYFVRANPVNAWHGAMLANQLPFMDAWYHFNDIHVSRPDPARRPIQARPNYLIQPADHPLPTEPFEQVEQPITGWQIYALRDSLPFVFAVNNATLFSGQEQGALRRSEVQPLEPYLPTPNRIELIAESPGDQTLVALYTNYPGWQVTIDGRRAELINLDGYLAIAMLPGTHKYVFTFRPVPFYIGLLISLIALASAILFLIADQSLREVIRIRRQQTAVAVRGLPTLARSTWQRLMQPHWIRTSAAVVQGRLQPEIPLPLAENASVQVTIETEQTVSETATALRRWWWATLELIHVATRRLPQGSGWFTGALLVYLAVRLIGLVDFPIYFFTDEAIQTLLAADLWRDGLKNAAGEFLPTYFNNVYQYNLSTSVYLQLIPYLLFGKSVFVTRLVPMLMTLLAAFSLALILRRAFEVKFWWTAPLILSIMPAWFLHSRTAFEAPLMVSFYAAGLYAYLLYRLVSPRYLYPTLILFALAFYSYSPGQVIVAVTAVLLLLSDWRYHFQKGEQRRYLINGVGLLILLILPYVRFRLNHPEALEQHLSNLSSYWLQPISLSEKIQRFAAEYLYGLSPQYWYIPNERDLPRHLMKGYGNLYWATLPLVVIGLISALRRWRSAAHRVVLAAFLAAPAGAALVEISITRALVMVVPATLLSVLGLDVCLRWLERWRSPRHGYAILVFLLLAVGNFRMLQDALTNGPTWYTDYGLGGMQYGARQLFTEVQRYLEQNPQQKVLVTASWANGVDILANFFLGTPLPIQLGSVEQFIDTLQPLDPNLVVVMTQEDYQRARQSGKFAEIQIERLIRYPDGSPGFLFTRLRYVDNIEALFEQERQARRELRQGTITLEGQRATVRYSALDMGQIQDVFDGNKKSVTRTWEANPYVIEITFPEPRQLRGISIVFGSTEARLLVKVTPPGGQTVTYTGQLFGSIEYPEAFLDFGEIITAQVVRIELTDLRQGEPAHVHIWEIIFH